MISSKIMPSLINHEDAGSVQPKQLPRGGRRAQPSSKPTTTVRNQAFAPSLTVRTSEGKSLPTASQSQQSTVTPEAGEDGSRGKSPDAEAPGSPVKGQPASRSPHAAGGRLEWSRGTPLTIFNAPTEQLQDKAPYNRRTQEDESNNAQGPRSQDGAEAAGPGQGDRVPVWVPGGPLWRQLQQDREAMRTANISLLKRVGGSSISTVYQALDRNRIFDGKPLPVAVKAMDWSSVSGEYQRSIYYNATLLYEWFPSHHNILRILQRYVVGPCTYLVCEWCGLGSLGQALGPQGCLERGVGEMLAREFYLQICAGLDFLFDKNVHHGRLTCENVLLSVDQKLKLADFGFPPSSSSNSTDDIYHLKFRAPELLRGSPYTSTAADIWSLGIVLYATLHAAVPYCVREMLCAERNINMPELIFRKSLSYSCRKLIRRLLTYNAVFRPDLASAARDPWALETPRLPVIWHQACYRDQLRYKARLL